MHLLKWDYSTLGWQDIKQALKKRHKKFRSVPIISIFEKARLWQQQDLTRFREKNGKITQKVHRKLLILHTGRFGSRTVHLDQHSK